MRRGEIWLINLDPTIGAEVKKTRPAIIVNSDAVGVLPLKVVVPLTDWKERYEVAAWMVKVEPDSQNGLERASAADTFQVRSVAQERFVRKLGQVDERLMLKIVEGLGLVLEIR
ncbi:MAG: type II toxin-antitoxin system PemK/MazF family toxin [Chloroflexi bacterium]|nr:type II toxin-antitoxin system PemK/MazF family toxin [Chloroflexota bacterium]